VEDALDVVVVGIPDVGGVVALGVLHQIPVAPRWWPPCANAAAEKASTASRLGAVAPVGPFLLSGPIDR
jgi:hypothetical protein